MISIIVPVYNEAECLLSFHIELMQRLVRIIDKNKYVDYEIIYINDGSDDNTEKCLTGLINKINARLITLSKNYGSHIAIKAGIDNCNGDCAIILSADLQDPPELIPQLINKWQEGNQVVWAVRENREDSLSRRIVAGLFYRLIKKIALPNYPLQGTGSFCLIDKSVIDAIKQCNEHNRVTFGLISWLGFKQTSVSYTRNERYAGKSKWNLRKMIKTAIDTICGYSYFPIRLASYLGLFVSFLSFIAGIYVIVDKVLGRGLIEGWASIMTAVLFLGGIQLIMLGVLGEYVYRTYDESKQRPLYVVKEIK